MNCDHSGTHSGAARFSRQTGQLRLIVVCDRCGAERNEVGHLDYAPQPCDAPMLRVGADASDTTDAKQAA